MDDAQASARREQILDRLLGIATALLLPVSLWIALTTVRAVIAHHHPLPFGDQWDAVNDLYSASRGDYDIRSLFRQHNEHRIPFARLLFLADARWFGGSGAFLQACILAMQLAHGLVLAFVVCRGRSSWLLKAAAAVLAIATFFSGTQMENFIWGFQVQFAQVYLTATVALCCLAASIGARTTKAGNVWLGASLLAAFCCTYGMANGLLVWPLLLSASLFVRAPRRAWLAITIGGTLCWVAYFVGYRFDARVAGAGMPSLANIATFVTTFLGNPVSHRGVAVASTFGWIALLAGAGAAARTLGRSSPRSRAHVVLVHVMAFCVGSALLAALGRIALVGEYGFSSRYATAALVYWCALGLLLVSMAVGRGRIVGAAGVVVTAAVVFHVAAAQTRGLRYFERRPQTQEQLAIALLMDVRDDMALRRSHGAPPDYVWQQTQKQRELGLPPFDRPERLWLGRRLEDVTVLGSDRVPGAFCSASSIAGTEGALRVSGWLELPEAALSRLRLVLVDEGGIVRGHAATDWPRTVSAGERLGWPWRGYCVVANGRADLRAFVIAADGHTARPLAEGRTVPGARSHFVDVTALRDAAPIDGVTGDVITIGAQQSAPESPKPGQVLGSWSERDRSTGSVAIGPIDARNHRALGLPVFLGLGSPALHLVLRRPDGTLICEVRELHDDVPQNCWVVWRIDLPDDLRTDLVFAVADTGAEWGQWLAVARPVWLDR